jgi:hypothetical protein
MSSYTEKMVTEMTEQGEFSYESAKAYAFENGLSTRSVISKVKNLGLPYTRKVVVKSTAGPKTTKARVVLTIADNLNIVPDTIAGLHNAPMADLKVLLAALPR